MLRQSVRKLSATAYQAAEIASKIEMSNSYGIQLAKAQGHVNGFVGGKANSRINANLLSQRPSSDWKHSFNSPQTIIGRDRLRDLRKSRVSKSWR